MPSTRRIVSWPTGGPATYGHIVHYSAIPSSTDKTTTSILVRVRGASLFLANSFVFLLLGFTIDIVDLVTHSGPIFIVVVAALLARTLMTVAVTLVDPKGHLARARGEQLVLIWGGLRGGLTIALTLALPLETPARGSVTALE